MSVSPAGRKIRNSSLVIGLVILAVVILVALNLSEVRDMGRLVQRTQPRWLAGALLLQSTTYVAQGQTWQVVTRAAGYRVLPVRAFALSLVTQFVNQVLPTAGLSGTLVMATALENRGIPRATVMASAVVSLVSYYAAFVAALGIAVGIAIIDGHASYLVIAAAVLFGSLGAVFVGAILYLSGREAPRAAWARRLPPVRRVLELLHEADRRLVRAPGLVARSCAFQLVVVMLDAATLWILILALGVVASPTGVFASFMISSLFRTIGLVPGGLGVFEAASVVTLGLVGVSVPVALAATLLFRGLSFWLPMLPGMLLWRRTRTGPLA